MIEFIISMSLGLIISVSAFQTFVSIKQIILTQQGLARIQENARILHIILGKAIESSGKIGCQALTDEVTIHISNSINAKYYGLDKPSRLRGIPYTHLNQLKLSDNVKQKIIPKSHLILVQSLKNYHELLEPVTMIDDALLVKVPAYLKKDQIIAISDCSHVDFMSIYEINNLDNNRITKIQLKPSSDPYFSKHYKKKCHDRRIILKAIFCGKNKSYKRNRDTHLCTL